MSLYLVHFLSDSTIEIKATDIITSGSFMFFVSDDGVELAVRQDDVKKVERI